MAITVFDEEQSVFFVGGRGDQSGRTADAGGCTKAWWDTECPDDTDAQKAAALAKLMGATGGPIITDDGAAYTVADDRITAGGGAFAGAEVGMIAYVIETPIPDVDVLTGRYKITDVHVGGDWIECAGINGAGDASVDVRIGGAFDELNNACDDTSATDYSVWLHTNLAETLAAAVTITTGGNNANNTFMRILGFNTVPGDMSRGGTYYQSPFEMLLAGIIDTTKTVAFDADGGAFENISITADNVIIENLYLHNNNDLLAAIIFVGVPLNIVFRNCRFADVKFVYKTAALNTLFDSCFAMDLAWHDYQPKDINNVILHCISAVVAGANFVTASATCAGTQVIGCIAVGGAIAVRELGDGITVLHNTFYGQTGFGVSVENGETAIVFNNIFMLNPGAVGLRADTAGSFAYNDYNCFIESDGTPLTVGEHSDGETDPVLGEHGIETDPLFEDPGANDFRLKSNSPCRRTGRSSVGAT